MKLLMSVYFSSFLSLSVLPQAQVVQLFILLILFHFEVPSFWIISWHRFLRIKNTLTWINEGECWAVDHLEINSVFCWDNKWNKSFKIESLSLVKNISTTFGPRRLMWGHVDPLLCSVVLYSLSFFNSLRIKRSTSATWPQEAGKSVKFWPMMRAQTWCKHKLLTSRHLSKQHRIWPLDLQIDFVISSYFLSTEEGSARRHMYRYTYQFPVKCQSTAVFYIMDIRCWCIEINSWWLKMLIKSLQKT